VGLCGIVLGSALIAKADEKGAAKEQLIAALTGTAAGTCPEAVMSPMLLDACEQQLSANRRMLSELGKIKGATYRGLQELPQGVKAEAYRVDFEKGSMTWLASLDSEGKLLVLWSNGEIRR
jgi:hypothetical protein